MTHTQSTGSLTPFERSQSFVESLASNLFFFETFQGLVQQMDNAEIRKKISILRNDSGSFQEAVKDAALLDTVFTSGAMFLEDDT